MKEDKLPTPIFITIITMMFFMGVRLFGTQEQISWILLNANYIAISFTLLMVGTLFLDILR